MRVWIRFLFYFAICYVVNTLSIRALTNIGVSFFWPANAIGAILAIHWRSRNKNYKCFSHILFIIIFFSAHLITSVAVEQKLDFYQQVLAVLVDTSYLIFYPVLISLSIRFSTLLKGLRRSVVILSPVVFGVVFQSMLAGVLFNHFDNKNDISFIITEWISEQLSAGLIVTVITLGIIKPGWRKNIKLKTLAFVLVLFFIQVAMSVSPLLSITSIAILPCALSIVRLDFGWSLTVTGFFLFFSSLSNLYFYTVIHDYANDSTLYPEIFSLRIHNALIVFISVILSEIVNQNRKLINKIKKQAETDALTGLFNRGYVYRYLRGVKAEKIMAVVIIDIDNFKAINDNFGHDIGDSVIKETGRLIQSQADNSWVVCRWGGEEFLMLIPSVTKEYLHDTCQKILFLAKRTIIKDIPDMRYTLSAGAYWTSGTEKTFHNRLNLADKMLYKAKRTGKDTVCIFRD